MPQTYTVRDPSTDRTVTFAWNGEAPPTDADMEEVFAEMPTDIPRNRSDADAAAAQAETLARGRSEPGPVIVDAATRTLKAMGRGAGQMLDPRNVAGALRMVGGTAQEAMTGQWGKIGQRGKSVVEGVKGMANLDTGPEAAAELLGGALVGGAIAKLPYRAAGKVAGPVVESAGSGIEAGGKALTRPAQYIGIYQGLSNPVVGGALVVAPSAIKASGRFMQRIGRKMAPGVAESRAAAAAEATVAKGLAKEGFQMVNGELRPIMREIGIKRQPYTGAPSEVYPIKPRPETNTALDRWGGDAESLAAVEGKLKRLENGGMTASQEYRTLQTEQRMLLNAMRFAERNKAKAVAAAKETANAERIAAAKVGRKAGSPAVSETIRAGDETMRTSWKKPSPPAAPAEAFPGLGEHIARGGTPQEFVDQALENMRGIGAQVPRMGGRLVLSPAEAQYAAQGKAANRVGASEKGMASANRMKLTDAEKITVAALRKQGMSDAMIEDTLIRLRQSTAR